MVKIKLFANLKEIVGKGEIEIEAKTVAEVLKKLSESYPELGRFIMKEGYVQVFVNLKRISDLNMKLNDNDTVAILPPVSGG